VDILVSAFFGDPVWSWAFPDPSARAGQQRALWSLLVAGALRYPWVWLASGNTATAVWIPPDGTELSEQQEASLEPLIVELMGDDAPRVLETIGRFEGAHPQEVPHFFLTLRGTRADQRGHGYGLGLLADNLRMIDQAAMPAYLEATNVANVPLYGRYGFEVIGSFTPPAGGPEVFTMWRDVTPLA
jgi:hypothetical protein